MKILNWNVNGLRAILGKGDLLAFMARENPDIMAFEETKMQESQLNYNFDGYYVYMNCAEKKGYSGTMVLTKVKPMSVVYDIEGEDHPKEGRVITLEYPSFYFVCAYVPNSKDGLKRIDYRMKWEDDLRKHLVKLDKIKPVIYTGDLNVAHNEIDLKNPDDKNEYWKLKEAVYYVSLAIKEAKVTHRFPNDLLDEMKDYYWGLLL